MFKMKPRYEQRLSSRYCDFLAEIQAKPCATEVAPMEYQPASNAPHVRGCRRLTTSRGRPVAQT
jgi:hypothetical protein